VVRAVGLRPGDGHGQAARARLSRASPEHHRLIRELHIGDTVSGRPIVARRYPPPAELAHKAPVLLFGAIHGDEPLGVYCLQQLRGELDAAPPGRDTWIIDALNLDGLAAGSKNNARDVDLNRNFAARNWQRAHKPGYDPGAAPESEPETQALVALIDRIGATRLVALHSPFRVVNYDGSGRALAELMAAHNGYGASGDIGYPTPGSFGSRYGVDLGLEVITLEIPLISEQQAWAENRGALRLCVDLAPG
jgi:protein MpaA